LDANTTGSYNTASGRESLLSNTEGNSNTALGYQAGDNITTGSSNIIIGSGVDAPSATGSNQLNIGNTIYGNTSTGNVGIGTDDPSSKLDVAGAISDTDGNVRSGRKNLIINGGFDVWQRGTSSTVDDAYGTADRWFKYASGDTTSWGKGTDSTVGNYCTVTATSTGYCNLRQRVEGFHISGTTDFTLSFYMKGSVGGFPIRLEVWNITGNNNIHSNTSIATGTTSWTKYTVTFQMDETDTYDNFHIMLGSNGATAGETLYLSQVQLELGSQATDFEHRSYGEELALCQRYYQRWDASPVVNRMCGIGQALFYDYDDLHFYIDMKQPMRSAPSITVSNFYAMANVNNHQILTVQSNYSSSSHIWGLVDGTPGTNFVAGTPYMVGFIPDTTGYFIADAEL